MEKGKAKAFQGMFGGNGFQGEGKSKEMGPIVKRRARSETQRSAARGAQGKEAQAASGLGSLSASEGELVPEARAEGKLVRSEFGRWGRMSMSMLPPTRSCHLG